MTATKAPEATTASDTHERIIVLIRALLWELQVAHEAGDTRRLTALRDGLAALLTDTIREDA